MIPEYSLTVPTRQCEGSRGKVVATWTHETNILYVSERVVDYLDHIVVTCFLNLWMWRNRLW